MRQGAFCMRCTDSVRFLDSPICPCQNSETIKEGLFLRGDNLPQVSGDGPGVDTMQFVGASKVLQKPWQHTEPAWLSFSRSLLTIAAGLVTLCSPC